MKAGIFHSFARVYDQAAMFSDLFLANSCHTERTNLCKSHVFLLNRLSFKNLDNPALKNLNCGKNPCLFSIFSLIFRHCFGSHFLPRSTSKHIEAHRTTSKRIEAHRNTSKQHLCHNLPYSQYITIFLAVI